MFDTPFKKITGYLALALFVVALVVREYNPETGLGFLVLAAIFGILWGLLNVNKIFGGSK